MAMALVVASAAAAAILAPAATAQQSRDTSASRRADAQAVVRGIEARYNGARTLRATFLERYSEGRRLVRVESGTVMFSRPGRMRWEYESPEEKLFLVDGKSVWFYVPADRTASRADVKESADWQTPFAILTRGARFARFCGSVELVGAGGAGGVAPATPGNHVVRCTPRSAEAGFREAFLEVDAGYTLERVVVRESGGIEIEFRFANWERDVPIPEVLFHFAAPAGVAIVEASEIAGP
jgi:outer membrane lipoprotein carrier protein